MGSIATIVVFQGEHLSYYDWFAAAGSTVLLLISLLNFVTYLILCKLALASSSSSKTIIQRLKGITFHGGFIALSIIPLVCQALHVLYFVEGVLGMMAVLALMVYADNGRRNWIKPGPTRNFEMRVYDCEETNVRESLQQQQGASALKSFLQACLALDKPSKKKLLLCLLITILANSFMYKTCLCFYNMEIGYYNHLLGFGINTYCTRLFQLSKACPPGAPCHVYATVPQDPSYAFFLNIHTHKDVTNVTVYYQELSTPDPTVFSKVTAETYQYRGLEWKADRAVHSALITGLKPDTKYLTKVQYDNQFWTNAVYRTLPDNNSRPIRMINAGDSGYTEAAANLSKIAAKMHPDIFFMGGDVAYDDNMPACAYTWDSFLNMYEQLTSTLGYLMPLVLGVGNHDVGLNELSGINVTVNNYGPAYFLYFPQHYDRNLDNHIVKRVPPINHRRSFQNYTFANIHYICLDSGYIHAFDGFQKNFMVSSFAANKDKLKFVNYHVPIYSVCQSFEKDPNRYLYALFHWVPNFDRFKVMTSFENHVHSFKRTKPMIGNAPSPNGTVYLGDGSYGALISEMCTPDITLQIFDQFRKSNNMWVSDVYADRVEHVAYDSLGVNIDNFTQYAANYKL